MLSPTGIIPEDLMFPRRLRDVMNFLIELPVKGNFKEQLLLGWARTVGVTLTGTQYRKVRESGIDRVGIPPVPVGATTRKGHL